MSAPGSSRTLGGHKPEYWITKTGPYTVTDLLSVLPVSRAALQVSKRDDDDLAVAKAVDDLVGETDHEQPAGLLVGRDRIPGIRIQRQSGNWR